jgi:hypothetical protein
VVPLQFPAFKGFPLAPEFECPMKSFLRYVIPPTNGGRRVKVKRHIYMRHKSKYHLIGRQQRLPEIVKQRIDEGLMEMYTDDEYETVQ